LLKGADRDYRAEQLRELWVSSSPVMVAVASVLDERLHHSSVELAVLLDDATRTIGQRVLASLVALPSSVPVVLMADHGFRENPSLGQGARRPLRARRDFSAGDGGTRGNRLIIPPRAGARPLRHCGVARAGCDWATRRSWPIPLQTIIGPPRWTGEDRALGLAGSQRSRSSGSRAQVSTATGQAAPPVGRPLCAGPVRHPAARRR
jgi:hypothetical protein